MTKEELEDMLHVMGLDYEAEADKIYVFYVHPDGRVDNFSISVRHGRAMSNGDIEELMRREYPSTREGTVMAVERPPRPCGHQSTGAQRATERGVAGHGGRMPDAENQPTHIAALDEERAVQKSEDGGPQLLQPT